ncbi:Asp23/Gls24 family envelope stress response protein [Streptomyces sp. NPDC049687]|uniref:Asp23/Gls24 family envelope stress response protein n=1 Tax=Streptomyces sp. NPDC049687 TaxID=3365596 RepID=UPI0037AEABEC
MTRVSQGTGGVGNLPGVVPAGERGATRIADRVVAKIAAQAAREAIGPLPPEAAPPHATVVVRLHSPAGASGGTPVQAAHIRVHLELGYPGDIGTRCHEVRRHVTERVGALVGMRVPEVAVLVERLHLTAAHGLAHGRTR